MKTCGLSSSTLISAVLAVPLGFSACNGPAPAARLPNPSSSGGSGTASASRTAAAAGGAPILQVPSGAGVPSSWAGGQGGQANPPTETNNCGTQKEMMRSASDVLLVLDRSLSMMFPTLSTTGALSTRYMDVVQALNQVLPETNEAVNWGLELFPGPSGGCTPGQIDVAIKPQNASAVSAAIDPSKVIPGGMTPVTASLANAVKSMVTLNDGNSRYIVLATDGEPNCGNEPTDALAAIGAAKDADIPVFVISLSTEGSPDTLNKMAVAGGKPCDDPNDPNTKYYKAETSAQLVSVMNAIRKQVATCEFTLSSLPPVPGNVLLVYDDGHRALPGSTTWGYTSADNTAISIYGDDCGKLKDGTYHEVNIIYGCPNDPPLIP